MINSLRSEFYLIQNSSNPNLEELNELREQAQIIEDWELVREIETFIWEVGLE